MSDTSTSGWDRVGVGMLYASSAGVLIGSSPFIGKFAPFLGAGLLVLGLLYETYQRVQRTGSDEEVTDD